MRLLSLLLTAMMIGGCYPTEGVLVDDLPVDEPGDFPFDPLDLQPVSNSRFVGTWLIEETVAHATYFASMWEFAEDGTLTLVEDFSIGGSGYPTVSWAGNRYDVCSFGDRWSSPDDETLRILGECTEGTGLIEIGFEADQSSNAISVSPIYVSVDGDAEMWSEPVWGWHFVKCEGDFSNCEPWTY